MTWVLSICTAQEQKERERERERSKSGMIYTEGSKSVVLVMSDQKS